MTEAFSPDERARLAPYFTNLDAPVFALVNLPEVVKGALFARYSRSPKSLRRLFLDEFMQQSVAVKRPIDDGGVETTPPSPPRFARSADTVDPAPFAASAGETRAEQLYEKVFFEYGDDSVAQLGGVHLACEQASNLLTKVLEWGRLMAYLEQSTRYIAYDARVDGRYRYWRDPEVLASPVGLRYIGDLDRLFDTYARMLPELMEWAR
ncbi:MAG TPA: thymidylate synthase, partial [Methylomirabilota bacterium]